MKIKSLFQIENKVTCNFPLSSLSPLHLTKILSSIDNRNKSRGTSTDVIIPCKNNDEVKKRVIKQYCHNFLLLMLLLLRLANTYCDILTHYFIKMFKTGVSTIFRGLGKALDKAGQALEMNPHIERCKHSAVKNDYFKNIYLIRSTTFNT